MFFLLKPKILSPTDESTPKHKLERNNIGLHSQPNVGPLISPTNEKEGVAPDIVKGGSAFSQKATTASESVMITSKFE